MRSVCAAALALFTLALASPSAHAERKVFLNGIDLSNVDVRGHTFQGCDVRFDKQGDVYITVKGLKIAKEPSGKAGKTEAKPADQHGSRYFLVVKPNKSGKAPYQVTVYINGELTHLVKGSSDMQVYEVTEHIKSGSNQVRMVAVRDFGNKKQSRSPGDRLEIVLGQGTIKKGTVVIQLPHVQYSRNASETRRFDDTFRFDTK